jgi:hypothetical protein
MLACSKVTGFSKRKYTTEPSNGTSGFLFACQESPRIYDRLD